MAEYFVDDATGNDADDGLSEANAFKTIDKSMNTVAAGDKVWVKNTNDYTETATIDTVGTGTSWIVFEGYTSTTGDGGKATIDGGSSRTSGITTTLTTLYHRFENFILKNHTGNGFNTSSGDVLLMVNCEFNNNGTRGLEADNAIVCVNCSATGNSGDGFGSDRSPLCINCTAHNNTIDGFQTDADGGTWYNCIASSNGAHNFHIRGSTSGSAAVLNCTTDGDGKDSNSGIKVNFASFIIVLLNSIFYDCDTGIDGNSSHLASEIGLNNLLNSNTTDYTDWVPTGTDVTGAPKFVDEANQDYKIAGGSAAANAGADNSGSSSPGMDIGAHQSADPVVINARRRIM